jgi:hypothetical protein
MKTRKYAGAQHFVLREGCLYIKLPQGWNCRTPLGRWRCIKAITRIRRSSDKLLNRAGARLYIIAHPSIPSLPGGEVATSYSAPQRLSRPACGREFRQALRGTCLYKDVFISATMSLITNNKINNNKTKYD